jgi:hypothetical protein
MIPLCMAQGQTQAGVGQEQFTKSRELKSVLLFVINGNANFQVSSRNVTQT